MLRELIVALANAKTEKEKSKVYRTLARLGMDKYTADYLVGELKKGAI